MTERVDIFGGGRAVLRVFPRRTSCTPTDDMAFVGEPPLNLPPADEVHVSCVFTWDRMESERLARSWAAQGYKVRIGGPAYDSPVDDFVPGRYVAVGKIFTSRGCIRRCPFCFVPQREGALRLLPIQNGYDILDNNLLACPRPHIEAVLDMLERQRELARFTGGIDARLCQSWFAERLARMRIRVLYTAFDSPGEWPHVERAIKILRGAGLGQRVVGCYVLVGYEGDTQGAAVERLERVFAAGGTPYAMFFRPATETRFRIPPAWSVLVRRWIRPAAIFAAHKIPVSLDAAPLFTQAAEKPLVTLL